MQLRAPLPSCLQPRPRGSRRRLCAQVLLEGGAGGRATGEGGAATFARLHCVPLLLATGRLSSSWPNASLLSAFVSSDHWGVKPQLPGSPVHNGEHLPRYLPLLLAPSLRHLPFLTWLATSSFFFLMQFIKETICAACGNLSKPRICPGPFRSHSHVSALWAWWPLLSFENRGGCFFPPSWVGFRSFPIWALRAGRTSLGKRHVSCKGQTSSLEGGDGFRG